jgi:hypothetical protein
MSHILCTASMLHRDGKLEQRSSGLGVERFLTLYVLRGRFGNPPAADVKLNGYTDSLKKGRLGSVASVERRDLSAASILTPGAFVVYVVSSSSIATINRPKVLAHLYKIEAHPTTLTLHALLAPAFVDFIFTQIIRGKLFILLREPAPCTWLKPSRELYKRAVMTADLESEFHIIVEIGDADIRLSKVLRVVLLGNVCANCL